MKTNTPALTLLVALLTAATQAAESGPKESVQHKLERIVVPKLELRDATLREAANVLKEKSAELDADAPVNERGVNIVFKLDTGTGERGLTKGAPGAAPAAGVPAVPASDQLKARITVSLTDVPLIEALRQVTALADCTFKVEPYAVSIVPKSFNTDVLLTKEWKIRPDLIPGKPEDKGSAKSWLEAKGIQFNGVASAIYVESTNKLILRNTQEQLDLADKLITPEEKK